MSISKSILNLAGQRRGIATVLSLHRQRSRLGGTRWHCKCDCGQEFIAAAKSLQNGHVKSCGCLRRREHDLSGQKFGMLKAEKLLPDPDKHGKRHWRCICDCGRRCSPSENNLRKRNSRSCGCQKKFTKQAGKSQYRDIVLDEKGIEHYMPAYVVRILGITKTTLRSQKDRTGRVLSIGWKVSCPFNDGEGLPTKKLANGPGREFDCFHGPTIDRVKKAMDRAPLVPEIPGKVNWLLACNKIGCCRDTLYVKLAAEGLRTSKEPAKGSDGRSRRRAYVPNWFVEKYAGANGDGIALAPGAAQQMAARQQSVLVTDEMSQRTDQGEARGRGRPTEGAAQERKRVCWELYTSGMKKTLAMREARRLLPENPPKEWSHLRADAKRHAKKNGLECIRPKS